MSKKIPLVDVFDGYCEYTYCKYNNDGCCNYDENIIEYMLYSKGDDYATCYGFDVKDGYCEDCGSELVEYKERHPYGDTFAYEYLMMCPNCG